MAALTSEQQQERRLQALAAEWQQILRLQDWEVVVRVVTAREMGDPGHMGTCEGTLRKKRAIIRVLREEDCDPSVPCDSRRHWQDFPEGQELVLAHELLEVMFWSFKGYAEELKPETVDAMEQAIHFISQALLKLKRASPPLFGRLEEAELHPAHPAHLGNGALTGGR